MKNQKKWWWEKDDSGNSILRFTVTSEGKTGSEWVKFFEDNKHELDFLPVEEILSSKDFIPSQDTTYDVVILRGDIVKDSCLNFERMFKEGEKRGYQQPPIEVACLIRKKLTDYEISNRMELWSTIIMHEPVKNLKDKFYNKHYNNHPCNMCIDFCLDIGAGLDHQDRKKTSLSVHSHYCDLDYNDGFAFILPAAPKK